MRDGVKPFDEDWRNDSDWQDAFQYAGNVRVGAGCHTLAFNIDDVEEVIAADPGENDGQSWMMAGKLKDGRYFFLDAWCDYTGWDCRAGGDAQVANTRENLIRFGMTEDGRSRLNLSL